MALSDRHLMLSVASQTDGQPITTRRRSQGRVPVRWSALVRPLWPHTSNNNLLQLRGNLCVWLPPREATVLGDDPNHEMLGAHLKRCISAEASQKLKRSWLIRRK